MHAGALEDVLAPPPGVWTDIEILTALAEAGLTGVGLPEEAGGSGGDAASQAINAVAGIFKQEMNDLIEANPNVIVVATTNFPHRVDDSLIRSGRFDVKVSVPKPDETGRV